MTPEEAKRRAETLYDESCDIIDAIAAAILAAFNEGLLNRDAVWHSVKLPTCPKCGKYMEVIIQADGNTRTVCKPCGYVVTEHHI